MTYETSEQSIYGGAPVEMYKFTYGTSIYGYSRSTSSYTYNGIVYDPEAISRTQLEYIGEMAKQNITISVPRTNTIAGLFTVTPPQDPVDIVIFRYHDGDDITSEVRTLWVGRVVSASFSGSEAKLVCESIFTSLQRFGVRRYYQRTCPHALYGTACTVSREAYKLADTTVAVSGLTVTTNSTGAQADQYYAGGFIEYDSGKGYIRRIMIESHVGNALTMLSLPYDLEVGVLLSIFPGCTHTTATCNSKFNNLVNYGGFPYIPQISPFGGATVY